MKSMKDKLLEQIVIPAGVGRSPSVFKYVDLKKSIVVSGLKRSDEIGEVDISDVNLNHLILNDMLLVYSYPSRNPNTGVESVNPDGMLFRIFRVSATTIGIAIFVKGIIKSIPDKYCYLCIATIKPDGTMTFSNFVNDIKPYMESNQDQLAVDIIFLIYLTQSYTRQVKSLPPKKFKYSKLSFAQRELHTEYTLDLSKPTYLKKMADEKALEKEKQERAEHERRGHYRTSKLGKKFFVRQTTVNKGASRKIVKDYKV